MTKTQQAKAPHSLTVPFIKCLCKANEMIILAPLQGLELAHQLIWLPFRLPILKIYSQQDDKYEPWTYVL